MPRKSLAYQLILKVLLMKIVLKNVCVVVFRQLGGKISLVVDLYTHHLRLFDIWLCVIELVLRDLFNVLVIFNNKLIGFYLSFC